MGGGGAVRHGHDHCHRIQPAAVREAPAGEYRGGEGLSARAEGRGGGCAAAECDRGWECAAGRYCAEVAVGRMLPGRPVDMIPITPHLIPSQPVVGIWVPEPSERTQPPSASR